VSGTSSDIRLCPRYSQKVGYSSTLVGNGIWAFCRKFWSSQEWGQSFLLHFYGIRGGAVALFSHAFGTDWEIFG